MKFERIPPPPHLKDHLQYFWSLESSGIDPSPKALGPLADGCPGMIFQPAEAGTFYDGQHKSLPEAFLHGQTVKRTQIQLVGDFRTVGVCFYPNSLKSIFGFDADELTDVCLGVDLLSVHLPEQLLHAASVADQIEILSDFLFARISKTSLQVDPLTRFALGQIVGAKGLLSLPELQKDLKLSERSLERRFNQHVGISPKLFARVCQFQSALSQLKNNRYARLSDVAYDNGYADQSHFIRTFRDFAGFSPCQWQKQAYAVHENFPVLIR
jgi:AraC-like DNA-binding protein